MIKEQGVPTLTVTIFFFNFWESVPYLIIYKSLFLLEKNISMGPKCEIGLPNSSGVLPPQLWVSSNIPVYLLCYQVQCI